MAVKTIDITQDTDKQIAITVNGVLSHTLYNANNLTIKNIGSTGAVVKLTDETWRQRFFLDDVVTEGGVQKSPFANQAALTTYLRGVFHN